MVVGEEHELFCTPCNHEPGKRQKDQKEQKE
jgi:hypothetical protein